MANRRSLLKKFFITFLTCAVALFFQPAQAQSADGGLLNAINAIRASLDAIVNTAATYIFQTPPNIGTELVTNNTQGTALKAISPNVKTLNDQDILTALSPDTQNPNQALTKMATIQASDTVLPSTLVGGVPVPFYSSAMQSSMQDALVQGNQNLNFQSFLTPLAYNTPDLQNFALNYVRFISGYALPLSNFSLGSYTESKLSTKQKLSFQDSASYQAYQVQRRTLVAIQSAVLSNLYYLYSKRLPIKTIHASDTALGVDAPSAAQIEDYLATWRTSSPTWYTQMSTASPTNVARETLFILAEIQAETHKMHQDSERMLALMAVNQLGTLQAGKQQLTMAERQITDQINQLIKANTNAGTSNQTSNTQSGQTPQQQNQVQQLQQQKEQVKTQQKQTQQQQQPNQPTAP